MVGVGIFTSLGFQVGSLPSGFVLMALWGIGAVCALCGALCYAELGAALPRSGGEYHFLGTIYHPAVGFLAGWISVTVGFAAPVAAAAMAFAKYFNGVVPGLNPMLVALGIVWLVTIFLLRDLQLGSVFQNAATILKVALLLVIIAAGWSVSHVQPVNFFPAPGDGALMRSTPFAVSLFWVMFAYSGWNASTYIVGEMRNPERDIPRSVGLGTLLVAVLYLGVNAAFLRSTPPAEMVGKPEVALAAGPYLFGGTGSTVMAALICAGLVSTVSAMMWIGPRVTVAMGEDLRPLRFLARKSAGGVPVVAMALQLIIVHVLVLTATFDEVVKYTQFSLQICASLTVLGVIIMRRTRPHLARPYHTWGYPVTPIIFLAISGWMLVQIWVTNPRESLWGLATMAVGLIFYFLSTRKFWGSVK